MLHVAVRMLYEVQQGRLAGYCMGLNKVESDDGILHGAGKGGIRWHDLWASYFFPCWPLHYNQILVKI